MFKQIQEGTQCANLFMFMNFCLVMTLFLIASPFDIGTAGGFTFTNISPWIGFCLSVGLKLNLPIVSELR